MNDSSAPRYGVRRLVAGLVLVGLLAVLGAAVGLFGGGGGGASPGGAGTTARTTTGQTATHKAASIPSLAGIPVGRWVARPDSPHARSEVSAALVGSTAYVVGGFGTDLQTSDLVERLNVRSGRWSTGTPLPKPLNHMSAVGYAGSLYVVGGYSRPTDVSAGAVRDFWRFDPTTARWTAMPPAPLARAAAGAAVLGHRLYVAGGRSDTMATIATTAIFDFDTGSWSLGPPLHHAREHVAAVAAGGSVWLLGGRALGQGNFTDVERLRPGAAAWQKEPPMPLARSSFQAVAARGKIVVVGGESASTTFSEVDSLDPTTGRWTRLADLPQPRHGLGLVSDDPLVYAIEGGPQAGLTTSSTVSRLRVG